MMLLNIIGPAVFKECDNSQSRKMCGNIVSFLLTLLYFLVNLTIFSLKSTLAYFIFSLLIALSVAIILFVVQFQPTSCNKKERISAISPRTTYSEDNIEATHDEINENAEQQEIKENIEPSSYSQKPQPKTNPANVSPEIWALRYDLNCNVQDEVVIRLIDEGKDVEELFRLCEFLRENDLTEIEDTESGNDNSPQSTTSGKSEPGLSPWKDALKIKMPFYIIIFNIILSFLSNFSVLYVMEKPSSNPNLNTFISLCLMQALALAQRSLILPNKSDFYSSSLGNIENSQTRAFSLFLMSVILYLLRKFNIHYYCIQEIMIILLTCMAFDFTIMMGLIGLPRTTIHWFIEAVNRYCFGFSGTTTILHAIIQFLRGAVVTVVSYFILYAKNAFWTRAICLFIISFICKIELNIFIAINAFIQAGSSLVIFCIFNKFLSGEKYSNVIEIIGFSSFFVFDVVIPYMSSISPYFFFYTQLIKPNRILGYVRFYLRFLLLPIILGSVIEDSSKSIYVVFLLVHSSNRCFTEPHVFGTALLLARFLFKYDFDIDMDPAKNLLICLLISRKFYSICSILFVRIHININIFNPYGSNLFETTILEIIAKGMKMFLFPIIFYDEVIAYMWSMITGAPINFFSLFYILGSPSHPRSNAFWDYPMEKKDTAGDHVIECGVYSSFIESISSQLANLIQSGEFGIVDENSFLLFHHDDMIIILHVISLNFMSVNFRMRCAEIHNRTLCHSGELRHITQLADYDFFRTIDTSAYLDIFQMSYSPAAQNVSLNGLLSYPINLEESFVSLSAEDKMAWSTYAVCFTYKKMKENNEIRINEIEVLPETQHLLVRSVFDQFEFNDVNEESLLSLVLDSIKAVKSEIDFFVSHPKAPLLSPSIDIQCRPEIEMLIKEAGKRSILYSALAASYLAPGLDETEDIQTYLNENEEIYALIDSDSSEIGESIVKIINQINMASESNDYADLEKAKQKEILTIISKPVEDGQELKLLFIRYSDQSKWNIFSLQREFVRSIWASECRNIIALGNFDNERVAMQENVKYLHNLIIQTSDIPTEYPILISKIRNSLISW